MKILKTIGASLLAATLLWGCGGGGSGSTLTGPAPTNPGTPGGGGGSQTPVAASLVVTTDSTAIFSDNSSTAKITAYARDSNNVLLAGVPVTFRTSSGSIAPAGTATDASGALTATLSTPGDTGLRTITVTATSGSLTANVTVQVIAKVSVSPAASVTVSTSTPTIPADGTAPAQVTAFVRDATNNLLPNVPVTFTVSSGGVVNGQVSTDASGAARTSVITAADPTPRTITVTARVNNLTATVPVQVVATSGTNTVQMGSGTGAGFNAGAIAASNANLSAGGSTSLQVTLQNSDGTLYTQPVNVTFNSPCVAQNFAALTPAAVTTSTGIAATTYTASGCSPSDVVTASATVGGRQLSATVTINVAAAAIGSVRFVSATPTLVALRGTGSAALPETSTVVFRVLDQAGNPRPGAQVAFSLNTSVGGVTLLNTTATSDVAGNAQTIVQSGTVATPVRVTAVVQGTTPTISTQSSQLTVSTGIPQQNSFSLSVVCPNVEAWNIDGVQVGVTARLSDRFNNPVPDGTAVSFRAEGGQVAASCQTALANGNSACTVNWTSQNPRPAATPAGGDPRAGRVTLFATAIGEESFTDTNGNGSFDPGENFLDIAERFQDDNESGTYQDGEPFYDFNNNGIRDAADGRFNGVLCNDPNRCDSNLKSTGISAQNLIVMSSGVPTNLAPAAGTQLNLARNASGIFTFSFADLNNNPLPSGTTIAATISGTGLTLGNPRSFTVPCTTEPTAYSFSITHENAQGVSGLLTLTITSPGGGGRGGITTIAQYPVVVP
jgi:hypothetical protein